MDLQYINDNKQIRNMNSLSMEKSIITVPVNEKSFKEENYDGTEAKEKLEEPIKTPPTSGSF